MSAIGAVAPTLPAEVGRADAGPAGGRPPSARPSRAPGGLLRGGASVGTATLVASGANYASNVVLGRSLSADAFADAALIVSSLLLISAVALALQLTVARRVAAGTGAAAVRSAERAATSAGIVIAFAVVLGSPLVAAVFNMGSPLPVAVFGLGVPIYLRMAVRRGIAQGTCQFGPLAGSILAEAVVRLIVTYVAVVGGAGPTSASIGLLVSFVAAAVACRVDSTDLGGSTVASDERGVVAASVLLLLGQVVISNGDLWVVAAVLPDDAGVYAAVALIGRLVFITAWAVATVVFPSLVTDDGGGRSRLLARAVGATAAFGGAMTVGAAAFGDALLTRMVGPEYAGGATLLWPYALATTLFVLANLIAVADVAAGRLLLPGIVTVGGAVQTTVLVSGAASGIDWVVWAQVVVMAALLVAVLTADAVRGRTARWTATTTAV